MDADVGLLKTPNIAEVAEALGAEGHTVRSTADVREISEVLSEPPSYPVVIDCKVNPELRHRTVEHLKRAK